MAQVLENKTRKRSIENSIFNCIYIAYKIYIGKCFIENGH